MTYNTGSMVLPKNAIAMGTEEMRYVDGGASRTVYGTAKNIRGRLTTMIGASSTGIGASTALGALLGGPGGAVVSAIIGGGWFNSYRSAASTAHNAIEKIIRKHGKKRRCKMTTTYSFAFRCTGISVSVA